jgi:hypothetical protein
MYLNGSYIDIVLYLSTFNGLPLNLTITEHIAHNISIKYINENNEYNISYEINKILPGLLILQISLNSTQKTAIQNGSATLTVMSPLKTGSFSNVAAGVIDNSAFLIDNNISNYYTLKFGNAISLNSTTIQLVIYTFYTSGEPTNLTTTQSIAKNLVLYYFEYPNSVKVNFTIVGITAGSIVINAYLNASEQEALLNAQTQISATTHTTVPSTNTSLEGTGYSGILELSGLPSDLFILGHYIFMDVFYDITVWWVIVFILLFVGAEISLKKYKNPISKHAIYAIYSLVWFTWIMVLLFHRSGLM